VRVANRTASSHREPREEAHSGRAHAASRNVGAARGERTPYQRRHHAGSGAGGVAAQALRRHRGALRRRRERLQREGVVEQRVEHAGQQCGVRRNPTSPRRRRRPLAARQRHAAGVRGGLCFLSVAKSSLGDAESSLGDAKSSLSVAKSSGARGERWQGGGGGGSRGGEHTLLQRGERRAPLGVRVRARRRHTCAPNHSRGVRGSSSRVRLSRAACTAVKKMRIVTLRVSVGDRSRGRYATPADSPRHDGTPYRGLRVRRWGLGFVHHSRTILYRPRQTPTLRFANFCIAVLRGWLSQVWPALLPTTRMREGGVAP
jgi:hypothetical protein